MSVKDEVLSDLKSCKGPRDLMSKYGQEMNSHGPKGDLGRDHVYFDIQNKLGCLHDMIKDGELQYEPDVVIEEEPVKEETKKSKKEK